MPKDDQLHIKHIRKSFAAMQTKEDLLNLLNYANNVIFEKPFSFSLHQLTWFSNPGVNKRRYISFDIPKKKTGQVRTIHAPVKGLKSFQKSIAYMLECVFEPHKAAMGFKPGKSVVDNAKVHAGNRYIYNIDLKDFFPSIDQARVWKCLQIQPFNLQSIPVANIISAICCTEMNVERINQAGDWEPELRNVLPQGAPTSPILSNIVCQRLDYLLSAVAKRFGAKYSRYADDITFSSLHSIYQADGEFLKELHRIISQQRFHIKEGKTRLQKQGYRQEVTGLTVNEKPNVTKGYIKQIRKWLYYWERYGYARASSYFYADYTNCKLSVSMPNMIDVLRGKLDFLLMVRGNNDPLQSRLRKRFMDLLPKPVQTPKELSRPGHLEVANIRPRDTVKFLKYFKYDNEYSFKHLVHLPVDESTFDFYELLKKAKSEFSVIAHTYNNKLDLPKALYESTVSLFQTLETAGVQYFDKTKVHPLEEPVIGKQIQDFKRNYRFGNEKSETTILSDVIRSTAERRKFVAHSDDRVYSFGATDSSRMFNMRQIQFTPDELGFKVKANFFTWVPNVIIAFGITFDNILKHANLNGERPFAASQKRVIIDLDRRTEKEGTLITLSILDQDSVFTGNIDSLLHDLRREYLSLLKGVCDFKVQFENTTGQSFETRVLPYSDATEKIEERSGGFKYIFTFYD